MATVDEIARAATAAVGGAQDALLLAHTWVNLRYQQLVSQVRYRHLRRAGSIIVPKAIQNAGTVTTTQGAPDIIGTGTAFDATMVGRGFRVGVGGPMYEIASVQSATQLALTVPLAEASQSDAGYIIVERYVRLPPETRFVQGWILARLWARLDERSLQELDRLAPGRPFTTIPGAPYSTCPGVIAHVGYNPDRNKTEYEFWPYSTTQDELLHYVWWSAPPTYAVDDNLPPTIDAYVLKEGVLCDVYRWLAAQKAALGRFDVAGYFGNEAARQETRWRRAMDEASRQDKGADDTTFLWSRTGGRGYGGIRTAQDDVWLRGRRFA